jgi:signal transduction histidine kinase
MKKPIETWGVDASTLLALSSMASKAAGWKQTIDDIFSRARKNLIFDNLVIYQTDIESQRLEVLYARAAGRGKTAEADVSWGELISSRVNSDKKVILEEPALIKSKNRLASPFLLGIPLDPAPNFPGVIVLIRFGGPKFSQDNIDFAQFLADLTASVIRQKYLAEFIAKLENERDISRLQADFVNTISHELRSPLGFIKGYTTTLLRKDTNWDQKTQEDFLEIIERETNNLTDLIDNLLDSSRLQSGQLKFDFQMVRIDSLIRDEISRALITNSEQKITLDIDGEISAVQGDARRLAQVFDNLLSNSFKYAPGADITVHISNYNDAIQLEFRDNGPGIPQQFLPKIFTRFFRVPEYSSKAHGSGLGLFICKQIIENHSGSILVSSSNNGTVFTIRLPACGNKGN